MAFFVVFPVINQIFAKLVDKEENFTHFIYGTMILGVLITLFCIANEVKLITMKNILRNIL